MTKELSPIQNVVIMLISALSGIAYPWVASHVPGFPLSTELFGQTIVAIFLAVAGWNAAKARSKLTGKINRAQWQ